MGKTTGVETGKDGVAKKGKHTTEEPSTGVANLFGEIAAKNFTEQTVKAWCDRDRTETSFCLKQGLGEVFLHGLNYVNQYP